MLLQRNKFQGPINTGISGRLRPYGPERRRPDDAVQPENAEEKRDSERGLPHMELGKFKAGAASEDGGEQQARGLPFELVPDHPGVPRRLRSIDTVPFTAVTTAHRT
jgi:hypothetical protein